MCISNIKMPENISCAVTPKHKPVTLDLLRERFIKQVNSHYHAKVEAEFQAMKLAQIEREMMDMAALKPGTIVLISPDTPGFTSLATKPRKACIEYCTGVTLIEPGQVQFTYNVLYMRGKKMNLYPDRIFEGQIIKILSTPPASATNP